MELVKEPKVGGDWVRLADEILRHAAVLVDYRTPKCRRGPLPLFTVILDLSSQFIDISAPLV